MLAVADDAAVALAMFGHVSGLADHWIMAVRTFPGPTAHWSQEGVRDARPVADRTGISMETHEVGVSLFVQVADAAVGARLRMGTSKASESLGMQVAGRAVLAVVVTLPTRGRAVVLVMVGQGMAGIADVLRIEGVAVIEVSVVHEDDVAGDALVHDLSAARVIDHFQLGFQESTDVLDILSALCIPRFPAMLVMTDRALNLVLEAVAPRSEMTVSVGLKDGIVAARAENAGKTVRILWRSREVRVVVADVAVLLGVTRYRSVRSGQWLASTGRESRGMAVAGRTILAVVVALSSRSSSVILMIVGQGVACVADVLRVDSVTVVEITWAHEDDVALDLLVHGQAALGMVDNLDELTDVAANVSGVLAALHVGQFPAMLVVTGEALDSILESARSGHRVGMDVGRAFRIVAARAKNAGKTVRIAG